MSILNSEHNDSEFSSLVPTRDTKANAVRYKLFKLLRKGGQNLASELCPRDPFCILTKAEDFVRNLPRWQRYVDELPMSGEASANVDLECEACTEALAVANVVVEKLTPLVEQGVGDHESAEANLSTLRFTIRDILIKLNSDGSEPSNGRQTSMPKEKANRANTDNSRDSGV